MNAASLQPNVKTAANLAFFLRDRPHAEVANTICSLVPQLYKFARQTHGHDDAASFTVAFMDAVSASLHEPAGHG